MDHRIADRRRMVSEDGARRRLRWGIAVVAVAALAGVAIVLFRSPLLSVRRISVSGAVHTDVSAVLEEHGATEGEPTISVRAATLQEAIEAEPWVARARVRVTWPGEIDVVVLEHVPSAWIMLPEGWMLASATGVVLERGEPPPGAPRVEVPATGGRPGAVIRTGDALAALEFLAGLPAPVATGAVVRSAEGGLTATVAGHAVVLGPPREMTAKAASLTAVLEDGIAEGASVSLVSARRPAISNPQPEVDPVEMTSTDGSG